VFGDGGRIAGIIDSHYNEFHGEKMGIWGFFECADDPEASSGPLLFRGGVGSPEGMTFMRGPLNPSTNYEQGCSLRDLIIRRP